MRKIHNQSFGILSTISKKGWSQSSGILFGSTLKDEKIKLYILTDKNYAKTKNIEKNNHISFVIPFPHYWLRFVPSFTIYFQGLAKILSVDDQDALNSYKRKRILKMELKELQDVKNKEKYIFLEINPQKKIFSYGVGFSLWETIRNPHKLGYSILIPS